MAPEVVKGEEHTPAIDWWSVGVMAFEFITGGLPFTDDSWVKVHENIVNRNFVYGDGKEYMSPEAYDFVMRLLDPDPQTRLGTKSVDEIKKHPFFAGTQWENLSKGPVPWKPEQSKGQEELFFPKAVENDDELVEIMREARESTKQPDLDFKKFDGICLNTLIDISKREAKVENSKFSRQTRLKTFEEEIMARSMTLAESLRQELGCSNPSGSDLSPGFQLGRSPNEQDLDLDAFLLDTPKR